MGLRHFLKMGTKNERVGEEKAKCRHGNRTLKERTLKKREAVCNLMGSKENNELEVLQRR